MIFVHGDMCDVVSPLAWAGPEDGTNSKEGRHVSDPAVRRPAKKQATQSFIHKDTD
jgi:hypothetical protein